MRKNSFLFFILGALVFSLLACNAPNHEHTYSTSWNYDSSYHWHDSTCGHDVKSDFEGHHFHDVVTDPTYEAGGYTTHTCTVCGYSYMDNFIDQLIHHYESGWTHDSINHWHACTDSGYEQLNSEEAPHTFLDVVTNPTYEAGGYTTHTCTVCGYSYQDNETERLYLTVTWLNYNGDVLATDDKVEYGTAPIYHGETPIKPYDETDIFTFIGWEPEIGVITENQTYVAKYESCERSEFYVTFNLNGGTSTSYTMEETKTKYRNYSYTLPSSIPARDGYIFRGWNNIHESTSYQPGDTFTGNFDVEFWAMWELYDLCDECDGTGRVIGGTCSDCNGNGKKRCTGGFYMNGYHYSGTKCSYCGATSGFTVINGIGDVCSYCYRNYGKIRTGSNVICSQCNGSGYYGRCSTCNGTGNFYVVCPTCDGSCGKFEDKTAPSVNYIGYTSIELYEQPGYEYSMDGATWQSSPLFENLKQRTKYTFYQRRATNGSIPFGLTSEPRTVTTDFDGVCYITYNLNGGTNNSSNPSTYSTYGSSITLLDPTRTGYTFAGWTYNGSTVTKILPSWDNDVTLVANWSLKTYSITYDYNKGYAADTMPVEYTCEDDPFIIPHPQRDGYSFTGWTGSNGDTPEVDVEIPPQEYKDLSYTANWTINTYSITYELFDGTNALKNPSTYTIEDSVELKDAKKDYHTFEGWYLDPKFTKRITNINGFFGDLTLYAHFVPYSYEGIFNPGDGYFNVNVTLVWGAKISNEIITCKNGSTLYPYELSVPTRSGYLFNGWYLDSSFTNPLPDNLTITSDLTIYARWFSVYDSSASELTSHRQYSIRSGSQISYFYVSPGHSGTALIDYYVRGIQYGSSLSAGVKCSQFRIEDKTSGGRTLVSAMAPQSGNYSSSNTGVEITLKSGHTYAVYLFAYDSGIGQARVDITPNDTSLSSKRIDISSSLTCEESYGLESQFPLPERQDYDFDGWFDDNNNQMDDTWSYTSDQSFVAHWKLHQFNIDYVLDGGTNSQSNPSGYTIEDPTIVLQNPTKEGYTFEGWFADPDFQQPISEINCESRKDYTIYAKWVADYFDVEYVLNGGTNNPLNISVIGRNEDFTLLDPSREGYTFEGWYLESSFVNRVIEIHGSARQNHKFYAKWTANTYTATLDYNGGQNCPTVYFYSQGDVIKTVDLFKGSTLEYFIPESQSDNYVFGGWYTDSACTNLYAFNETISHDLKLYAKWVDVSRYQYSSLGSDVNVQINGNEYQYIDIVLPFDQTITITSSSGLDLYGVIYDSNWNVIASCDDISDDNLDFSMTVTLEAGKVYYIAYKANQILTTGDCTISITGSNIMTSHAIGDYTQVIESISATYDASFTLPTPKRDGYIFVGWFDENGNPIDPSSWNYSENITIYAHWIPTN